MRLCREISDLELKQKCETTGNFFASFFWVSSRSRALMEMLMEHAHDVDITLVVSNGGKRTRNSGEMEYPNPGTKYGFDA